MHQNFDNAVLVEKLMSGLEKELATVGEIATEAQPSYVQSWQISLEDDLAAMAADPAIQRELRLIEEEFAVAALDGLATLA